MNLSRHNIDFAAVDTSSGFTPRGGGIAGIHEKILSNSLNTTNKTGCRTRLLRLETGAWTPAHIRMTTGKRSTCSKAR